MTWRERRQDINRLQRQRRFNDASGTKQSFRVEIEALKRRTRCRKCGKVGHWARERRSTTNNRTASTSSSTATPSSDVHFVEHGDVKQEHEVSLAQVSENDPLFNFDVTFVGAAECWNAEIQPEVLASGLVSSPGFGVIDSGCGRTLIGRSTLDMFKQKLRSFMTKPVEEYATVNMFRYGNGATETSTVAALLPVAIGGLSASSTRQ